MSGNIFFSDPDRVHSSVQSQPDERWQSFEEILQRLHAERVFIHPEQLAAFMLAHGLPVHLRYVPTHLQERAIFVNEHYQGDMACLVEEPDETAWQFPWLNSMIE